MKISELRPFLGALNYRLRGFGSLTISADSKEEVEDVYWQHAATRDPEDRRVLWTITCDNPECKLVYDDDATKDVQRCPRCGQLEPPRPDITQDDLELAAMAIFFGYNVKEDVTILPERYKDFAHPKNELFKNDAYESAELAFKTVGIRTPKRKEYS